MQNNFPSVKEVAIPLFERIVALQMIYKDLDSKKYANFDFSQYTTDELVVIFELLNQDGLYQNEITEKIHKNKSTIKRTLDKLEKKQAIFKVKDKNDSRKFNIYLTDELKKAKETFFTALKTEEDWFVETLGKKEHAEFMKNLNLIYVKMIERYNEYKDNKG